MTTQRLKSSNRAAAKPNAGKASPAKRTFGILATCLVALGALTQTAEAAPPYGPPGIEPGPNYRHASTVLQGYLDGLASLVRAQGLFNYNSAIARAYDQEAIRQSVENRYQYLNYRADVRGRWRDNYGYRRRFTGEQLAMRQVQKLPPRLEPSQLDVQSGWLAWPEGLMSEDFTQARVTIERAFVQRATTGSGRGSPCHGKVKQAVLLAQKKLGEKLRAKEIPGPSFLAAHRFLRSVRYEAQQPLVPHHLAGR